MAELTSPTLIAALAVELQAMGSDANGHWALFANGIQVCWVADYAWSSDSNGNFSWVFPKPFVSGDVTFVATTYSGTHEAREHRPSSTSSSTRVKIVTPAGANYSNQSGTASFVAIGRWK